MCAGYVPGRALLWVDLAGVAPSTATTGTGGLQFSLGAGRGTLSMWLAVELAGGLIWG